MHSREREIEMSQRAASSSGAEALYRSMFENAIEGIYQSTPEGRFIVVNNALARLYGYERAEDVLTQVSDIQNQVYADPGLRERFKHEIESTGVVQGLEYQVRRRDGAMIWISETARLVRGENGSPDYYEGFIEDITARKEAELEQAELEKQILHAQKLEAIGTLASGMAHDFNNILGAILGYTELALHDEHIRGATRQNLELALKSGERAKELVKRILTFSRPAELQSKPIKITPILNEAVQLLHAALPSTIEISVDIRTEADIVIADATELHQLVMNLGVNAKHAMTPGGGRLRYSLDLVDSAEASAQFGLAETTYVRLTVDDTGHGMSKQVLERIFDPFFTTKPTGTGTGLGLTFVHRLATRSGGKIAVDSVEGKGSKFQIFLPQSAEEPGNNSGGQLEIVPGRRERVLIVDDEVLLLSMMQQRLRRMNYRVITRADSVSALETFKSRPAEFDLVITDHTMPSMQGAELAEKLGDIRPNIPVILVTGLNLSAEVLKSRYSNRRAILEKPVDFARLSRCMRWFLD